MTIAVLSDIHANVLALQAVLEDAYSSGVKQFWILGDLVGYGPQPNEVIEQIIGIREPKEVIVGNHDAMFLDLRENQYGLSGFHLRNYLKYNRDGFKKYIAEEYYTLPEWNETGNEAVQVISLQHDEIRKNIINLKHYRKLFPQPVEVEKEIHQNGFHHFLVHGTLGGRRYDYLYPWDLSSYITREIHEVESRANNQRIIEWFGHTHIPSLISFSRKNKSISSEKIKYGIEYPVDSDITLINPGSVGQPRNLDTGACYIIFDESAMKIEFRRITYPHTTVFYSIVRKGYPEGIQHRFVDAKPGVNPPDDWVKYFQSLRESHG